MIVHADPTLGRQSPAAVAPVVQPDDAGETAVVLARVLEFARTVHGAEDLPALARQVVAAAMEVECALRGASFVLLKDDGSRELLASIDRDLHVSEGGAPRVECIGVPIRTGAAPAGVLELFVSPDEQLADVSLLQLELLAAHAALALDAMARVHVMRRQRAQERMFATALSALRDPVLLLDGSGCIQRSNAAVSDTYGYEVAELTGMPFSQLEVQRPAASELLIPAGVRPHMLPHDTPAFTSVPDHVWRSRQEHRRRDGSIFPVSLTRAPVVDDAGNPAGEVVLVKDLTHERQVEEHVRQHDKLAALGELVAGVAHELNNPLTGISAFAQLLLEDPLTDQQLESVTLVKREADRAAAVINDLMLFARKTGPSFTLIDLNDLVRSTVRLRAYHLQTSGVKLLLELAELLPLIHGDEHKLRQVLMHLLANAEDALKGVPDRSIRVRTVAEADRVILEVHDSGRGMTEQARAHAFDPFFTTKSAEMGSGLGLSVSYGIVEAHGGLLVLDSAPGRHTTVRVLLPRPTDSATSDTDR